MELVINLQKFKPSYRTVTQAKYPSPEFLRGISHQKNKTRNVFNTEIFRKLSSQKRESVKSKRGHDSMSCQVLNLL